MEQISQRTKQSWGKAIRNKEIKGQSNRGPNQSGKDATMGQSWDKSARERINHCPMIETKKESDEAIEDQTSQRRT